MRVLKIVVFSFVGLIVVGVVGVYFYFKKVFKFDLNYLEFIEVSGVVFIEWVKLKNSDIVVMYLFI